jgi:hypothetical protein
MALLANQWIQLHSKRKNFFLVHVKKCHNFYDGSEWYIFNWRIFIVFVQLSLRDNPLVVHFVRHMASRPLKLCELAARCVQTHRLPYENLPRTLVSYLDTAHRCVNPQCQGYNPTPCTLGRHDFNSLFVLFAGVFFDSRVEHVKFVDFCGKYRVPLLQYLCSARCIGDNGAASADPPSDQLLRKVLLGWWSTSP